MKKDRFLKQFAVIGSSTFINMILGLLSTPIITRIVDPTEYGQLSIFTMYSSIAIMVLCMGLDQATVRYYYENDCKKYKQALLFKCVCLPVISCVTVCTFIIILSASKLVRFEAFLLPKGLPYPPFCWGSGLRLTFLIPFNICT